MSENDELLQFLKTFPNRSEYMKLLKNLEIISKREQDIRNEGTNSFFVKKGGEYFYFDKTTKNNITYEEYEKRYRLFLTKK